MKTYPWKEYWKWFWQKVFSLFISVSIYGLAIISIFVICKIISPEVFRDIFIAIVVSRVGKDIFDRLNNKNQKGNNDVKIQN